MNFFEFFLYMIFAFEGIFIIVGIIIGICNSLFYKLLGNKSYYICVATGIVGTPIHELGHALFCIIFRHKITDIKLYQLHDQRLGYVSHSYNPRNLYQQIGNFFIGIGPILLGTIIEVLLLILWYNNANMTYLDGFFNMSNFNDIFNIWKEGILSLFHLENFTNPFFFIFIILSFLISIHMNLSKEDIKGSIFGFILFSILILIAAIIIYYCFNNNLNNILNSINIFVCLLVSIFMLTIFFSLLQLLVALLFSLIGKLVKGRK